MKLAITLILLTLLFSGCGTPLEPQVITKEKLICTEQYSTTKPSVNIKILNEDWNIAIAQAFKDSLNEAFLFYENQVKRNNELCEDN